jgi:hypothetical protein
VKTTLRPVRRVRCPIEPETLLAQIQGELPIDELREVQRHLQTCEKCRLRSEALREAYAQVAVLAEAPYVPAANVREAVLRDSQGHLRAVRLTHGLNLPARSFMFIGLGALVALVVLIVAIARPLLQSRVLAVGRSHNTLSHLAPVGVGTFYAETVKLVPISYQGSEWDVGEIVAISERNGQVVQSLPASSQSPFLPLLGIGSGANVRPALSPDGSTIVEAAIAGDGQAPTAFAAIDTATGRVRYVARLALPSGLVPQAEPTIQQMWITPDGQNVLVLTDLSIAGHVAPSVLSFNLASGRQASGAIPPPDANAVQPTLGDGPTILAADGSEIYNAAPAADAAGTAGERLTFINVGTGDVDANLFIPGSFQNVALAVTPDNTQLLLVDGETATIYFISTQARALLGTLSLAGSAPAAAQGTATSGGSAYEAISVAVTPYSGRLFIALDKRSSSQLSYNLWSVSISAESFLSVTQEEQPVGTVATTSDGSSIVLLRSTGELQTLAAVNPGLPQQWVVLDNGTRIVQLVGGFATPAQLTPTPVPPTVTPSS